MKKISAFVVALFIFNVSNAFAGVAEGEALFKSVKCKNCHNITEKKKVGPGLKGVSKRASDDWVKAWLENSKAVWTANEGYTRTLKKVMKKESKPKPTHKVKKKLTEQEIKDLMDYMKTL